MFHNNITLVARTAEASCYVTNYQRRESECPPSTFSNAKISQYVKNRLCPNYPNIPKRTAVQLALDTITPAIGGAAQVCTIGPFPIPAAICAISCSAGAVLSTGLEAEMHAAKYCEAYQNHRQDSIASPCTDEACIKISPGGSRYPSESTEASGPTYSSQSATTRMPSCICDIKKRNGREDRIKPFINFLRNVLDIARFKVSIASSITSLLPAAAVASVALGVTNGVLGAGIGAAFGILNFLKTRKISNQMRKAHEAWPTKNEEKGPLFKILDKIKRKGLRLQLKNAKIGVAIYGCVAGLGLWGIVSGALTLAGIATTGIATAGAIPACLFLGALVGWGAYGLYKLIKKHRAQKALHSELRNALQELEFQEKNIKYLSEELKEAREKEWDESLSKDLSKKDQELFQVGQRYRQHKEWTEQLCERYLERNPETSVEYLLRTLFSAQDPPAKNLSVDPESKEYLRSRCENSDSFEDYFQLLTEQWKRLLEEEEKTSPKRKILSVEEDTQAQQRAITKLKKQAIRTTCKILGLEI